MKKSYLLVIMLFVTSQATFAQNPDAIRSPSIPNTSTASEAAPKPTKSGLVKRIESVEVLVLMTGERITLAGVAAPDPRRWTPGFISLCNDHLAGMVKLKEVEIAYVGTPTKKSRRAYIFLKGNLVNEQIIASGRAFARSAPAHPLRERFLQAQRTAKQNDAGLWDYANDQRTSAYIRPTLDTTTTTEEPISVTVMGTRSTLLGAKVYVAATNRTNRSVTLMLRPEVTLTSGERRGVGLFGSSDLTVPAQSTSGGWLFVKLAPAEALSVESGSVKWSVSRE